MPDPVTPSDAVRASINALEELPPLPLDTQRLLQLLADENVDIGPVAALIEQIPPLAARVVGLSRSAYFARGKQVHSVSDAIIRVLGLKLVKSLAIGIAISGEFDLSRCRAFSASHYWASALSTGSFSRLFARHAGGAEPVDPELAYLCGLLHNLGLLALVHVLPDAMTEVLVAAADHPEQPLTEIERAVIGFNHCQAGAWLAMRWRLPEEVGIAVEHHHELEYRGDHRAYALLVVLGVRWGRQRLAGVEDPWIEPVLLDGLGIQECAFQRTVKQFESSLGDIDSLSRLFA